MKTLLLPFGAFQLNGKFPVELFRDSLSYLGINSKEKLQAAVDDKNKPLYCPYGGCVWPGLGAEGFEVIKKWLSEN